MPERVPSEGRYAHLEREQRWRVEAVPAEAVFVARIMDRYITGTRLRLRRIELADGEVLYKLAQKVRVDDTAPERVKLTNVYLSADEYDVFATLPAATLEKGRWRTEHDGRAYAVDVVDGAQAGLVLAETELGADEPRLPAPPFAAADVTDDDRYSGAALATVDLPR